MRGIGYALVASGALTLGALMSAPAAAGCYGDDCDREYYRSEPVTHYRSPAPSYERYEKYVEGPTYYRSYRERYYDRPKRYATYHGRPKYETSSYERPRYHTTYYERPAYSTTYYAGDRYDNGYSHATRSYRHYRPYKRTYYDRYYQPYYSTARYGGAWTQTGPSYAYWGRGCHTAYIPYGWTWYRARSC